LGHAYSILRVVEESDKNGTHRLVQLRNPHGMREWRGAWSDDSEEWTDRLKRRLHHESNAQDGVFWMSLDDLMRQFQSVFVCRIFDKAPWVSQSREGEWSREKGTAAGCPDGTNRAENNVQYHIKVSGPTECFIRLSQEEAFEKHDEDGEGAQDALARITGGQNLLDQLVPADAQETKKVHKEHKPNYIGFFVVHAKGQRVKEIAGIENLFCRSGDFVKNREVSCEVRLVPQSTPYTLIPCTSDPDCEGRYRITIHSNRPVELTEINPKVWSAVVVA
jgi:RNase P subunit RPR2